MRRLLGSFFICFALGACGGSGNPGGSGSNTDSTAQDGGVSDAGPADAGAPDAGPTADCAGLVPGSLGTSLTFDVPGSGKSCVAATSDGNGMIVAESHDAGTSPAAFEDVTWNVFDVRGAWQGNFVGGFAIFPQATGFEGYSQGFDTYWNQYGSPGPFVPMETRFLLVPGYTSGTVAFGVSTNGIAVHRIDGSGNEVAKGSADLSGSFDILGGAEDASGAVVVIFQGNTGTRFLWFDPSLHQSVAASTVGGAVHEAIARPLLGGGVAVRLDGRWTATVKPADGTVHPAPAWLSDGTDFTRARGGKAYALWSGGNAVDLVSPQGNACGRLPFPGVTTVSLGADGTAIGGNGGTGCTKVFWPGALR